MIAWGHYFWLKKNINTLEKLVSITEIEGKKINTSATYENKDVKVYSQSSTSSSLSRLAMGTRHS